MECFRKKLEGVLRRGNLNFIKSDSEDISGIKSYRGIHKLKVAGKDCAIVISKIYREENNGTLFFIATELATHQDLERDIDVYKTDQIQKCASFKEALDEIEELPRKALKKTSSHYIPQQK